MVSFSPPAEACILKQCKLSFSLVSYLSFPHLSQPNVRLSEKNACFCTDLQDVRTCDPSHLVLSCKGHLKDESNSSLTYAFILLLLNAVPTSPLLEPQTTHAHTHIHTCGCPHLPGSNYEEVGGVAGGHETLDAVHKRV